MDEGKKGRKGGQRCGFLVSGLLPAGHVARAISVAVLWPWQGVEVLHPSAHGCAEQRARGPLHSPSLADRRRQSGWWRSEEARQEQETVLGWEGPCRGCDCQGELKGHQDPCR